MFYRAAMTLKNLLDMTSDSSVSRAVKCIPRLKKADPKNFRWTFTVKCADSKNQYDVRFKLKRERGADPMNRTVFVSCECPSWKYNGPDYNAKTEGYSERKLSDGSAPDVRDPSRRFKICKHVAAAATKLFKNYVVIQKHKQRKSSVKQPLREQRDYRYDDEKIISVVINKMSGDENVIQ